MFAGCINSTYHYKFFSSDICHYSVWCLFVLYYYERLSAPFCCACPSKQLLCYPLCERDSNELISLVNGQWSFPSLSIIVTSRDVRLSCVHCSALVETQKVCTHRITALFIFSATWDCKSVLRAWMY